MDAPPKPQSHSSLSPISAEKRAELEFGFVKDEMRARTEFNRRVHYIQFTVFGGIVAATQLFAPDKLNSSSMRVLCIGGLLINYVLLHELTKNSYYVRAAAFYVVKVINQKFEMPISEWEHYLHLIRNRSARWSDKYAFYLDTNLTFPIFILVCCCAMFVSAAMSDSHAHRHFRYFALFLFGFAAFINVYGLFDYVRGRSQLGRLFKPDEVADFAQRYGL